MKALMNIIWKEILEMARDPKFIVGFLVSFMIFPLMAGVFSMASAERGTKLILAVIDLDRSRESRDLIELLSENSTLKFMDSDVEVSSIKGVDALIIIPENFSEKMREREYVPIKVYFYVNSTGMFSLRRVEEAKEYIDKAVNLLRNKYLGPLPKTKLEVVTVFRERTISSPPEIILGLISGPSFAIVWAIFMILIFTLQFASASIVVEKEYKTIEILMTQPVRRITILAGKLIASLILAILGSVVMFAGLTFYVSSIAQFETIDRGKITVGIDIMGELIKAGLWPTNLSIILYVAVIFASLLSMLALAILIGMVAEDTRSAQSLGGILITLLIFPAIILMLIDVDTAPLPLRVALMAIPYAHTMVAGKAAMLNDYMKLIVALLYNTIFSAALMVVAAKLYTTEKLLTLRITLRRKTKAVGEE